MIQDIYPHKLDISFKVRKPEEDSYVFHFSGMRFLCRTDADGNGNISVPEFASHPRQSGEFIYLFDLDGRSMFLDASEDEIESPGYSYENMRLFREGKPKELMFALSTAYHLSVWHRDNRYCGRCGAKMIHSDRERKFECPQCGNSVYPRIMPSVIVGVVNGDSILVTRYNMPNAKMAALVAGFCEIGETAEDTVRREVMEETGIRVKNIRYYASQPWGISAGGLLLGFWCDLDGDAAIHVDGEEIAEAAWVRREELKDYIGVDHPSLTSEMMAVFAEGKEK